MDTMMVTFSLYTKITAGHRGCQPDFPGIQTEAKGGGLRLLSIAYLHMHVDWGERSDAQHLTGVARKTS